MPVSDHPVATLDADYAARRHTILARVTGLVLLAGAGLMFAGGGLPFITSLGGEAWTSRGVEQLAVIAGAPTAWLWANGLILAGTVLTVSGVAAATRWLEHHDVNAAARASAVAFSIGAGLWIAALVMRMSVTLWAADLAEIGSSTADVYEAFDLFQERSLDVFMALGLGSLALIGVALLPRMRALGAALVLVAALGVGLGIVERIPAFVYMASAVLGAGMLTASRLNATPDAES